MTRDIFTSTAMGGGAPVRAAAAWHRELTAVIEAAAGLWIFDEALPTPFVYVDLDVLEGNIVSYAEAAREAGLRLRPHVKTHKIAAIAQMQLAAGAAGLTVAKLGEAEALICAGVETEYLVAQPFWNRHEIGRLFDLKSEIVVSVDSVELMQRLSEAAVANGRLCRQVIVVDTGYHRFGVRAHAAIELALRVSDFSGAVLAGIRSHAGHVYGLRNPRERATVTAAEIETMSEVAGTLRARGLSCPIVSIGSTPAADSIFGENGHGLVNEARPGNYVFFDRMMVSLGACSFDRCALRIVCGVVSSHQGRALIDGGKLTFSSTIDPFSVGYGAILGRPNALIESLSQECAIVSEAIAVGERVVVVPNHACEITNLAPVVYYGREERIEGAWGIDARTAAFW